MPPSKHLGIKMSKFPILFWLVLYEATKVYIVPDLKFPAQWALLVFIAEIELNLGV